MCGVFYRHYKLPAVSLVEAERMSRSILPRPGRYTWTSVYRSVVAEVRSSDPRRCMQELGLLAGELGVDVSVDLRPARPVAQVMHRVRSSGGPAALAGD